MKKTPTMTTIKPSKARELKVMVRLSAEEAAAFEATAAKIGLTTATWLRLVGRKNAGLPTLGE
jgi:hypothetical protein